MSAELNVAPPSVRIYGDVNATTNGGEQIVNQSEFVDGLALKADKNSLSIVATTGSYTSLLNTPVLSSVAISGSYSDLVDTPNLATVATTGSYTSLSNTPTLATVATTGSYTSLSNTPTLATVATTGLYSDLSGKPTLAAVATTGSYTSLLNTPVLSSVAISGSYSDLVDKPTIVTSHSNLTNLNSDDHLQYVSKDVARTITARHTINPSAVGSPFILGANAMNQLVSGFNAELVNGVGLAGLVQNAGGTPSIVTNTLANRPATTTTGQVFIASDVNKIYRYSGSAWVELSPTLGKPIMQLISGYCNQMSGTTLIPADTSRPLSTEGTELWYQSVTPTATTSSIVINSSIWVSCGTAARFVTLALFKGTTFLTAATAYVTSNTQTYPMSIHYIDTPGSTAATGYSMRIGVSSAATWYLNRNASGSVTFSGMSSKYSLMEIL